MPYPSPCRDRRTRRGRPRATGRGEPGGERGLLTEHSADHAAHGIDGERLDDEVGFRVEYPGAQADMDGLDAPWRARNRPSRAVITSVSRRRIGCASATPSASQGSPVSRSRTGYPSPTTRALAAIAGIGCPLLPVGARRLVSFSRQQVAFQAPPPLTSGAEASLKSAR